MALVVAVVIKQEYVAMFPGESIPCMECDPLRFCWCRDTGEECRRFKRYVSEVE